MVETKLSPSLPASASPLAAAAADDDMRLVTLPGLEDRSLDDEDWEGGVGAEAVPKPGGGGGGPDRALPMLKKSRVSFRVASRSPLSSSRLIDGSVSSAAFAFFTAAAAASFGVIFVLLAPPAFFRFGGSLT